MKALFINITFCILSLVAAGQQKVNSSAKETDPSFISPAYLNFWVVLALLLSATSLYMYSKLRQKIDGKIRRIKEELKAVRDIEFSRVTTVQAGSNRDLKDLESKIADQNDSIQKMQRLIDELMMKPAEPLYRSRETERWPSREEVFYMVGPSYNYFPLAAKVAKTDALYKFTLMGSDREAKFEILNDGLPLETFTNYTSSYIDAACDAQNRPSSHVRNIRTVKPGSASLQGDKWYINSKAEIVYE